MPDHRFALTARCEALRMYADHAARRASDGNADAAWEMLEEAGAALADAKDACAALCRAEEDRRNDEVDRAAKWASAVELRRNEKGKVA